jgi:hypothetical protein
MLLDNKKGDITMRSDKREQWICPCCGSDDAHIEDYEFDIDCLTIWLRCHDCGEEWTEYALLTYDGYAKDGRVWDKEGWDASV